MQHDASAQCFPFPGASVGSPAATAAASDSSNFESAHIDGALDAVVHVESLVRAAEHACLVLDFQALIGDEVAIAGEWER